MTQYVLILENISKRFGATIIADEISLHINQGEFFTFLGPSGSGKSTILRMVAGLEELDGGRIFIKGRDVVNIPPWSRNLGMVFQQYAIFPHMTVSQNIAYGLKAHKWKGTKMSKRVDQMLNLVGLSGMGDKNATLLSGGEQQRVALARALAPQPSILLLDEPLSALDEKIRREMQTELKHIQRQTGTTFLYVTHDQEEALTMSDRIAVLNNGAVVQCDAPETVHRRPRTRFVARFFRGCNVLDVDVASVTEKSAVIRFGGASIQVSTPPHMQTGRGKAGLAVRAENLRLGAGEGEYPLLIEASLREMIYRGTNIDYLLELDDGQTVTATSTRRYANDREKQVIVGLDPEDLVLLED